MVSEASQSPNHWATFNCAQYNPFPPATGVTEDMWTPYKHLYTVFQATVANPSGVITDLELCLKKYKHSFTNFLRNPVGRVLGVPLS